MRENQRILVVDDDRDLVEVLEFALRRSGFEVLPAYELEAAVPLLARGPELLVLDLNLGERDGLELLRIVRERSRIPVLILTARDTEDDTVRALEMGADDYITKPFSYRELIARIRANLRRAIPESMTADAGEPVIEVGAIRLDVASHIVIKDSEPVDLTVTEFRLLRYLLVNAGVAVSTRAILRQVWGYDDPAAGDLVRVAVHRLRRKLNDNPTDGGRIIQTIPGIGFRLNTADQLQSPGPSD